ncbi:hypothetical protein FSP39_004466, partial [Pinctada imbricata]
ICFSELKRVEQGGAKKVVPTVEAHHNKPQGIALKVRIPLQEYPKFNFVGKLLGPKGMSLKRLQEETGTKMSILGKGSMKDKGKEEELKKEGGKYAHLNEDLHVLVEVYSEISDAYARLSHALGELSKFLSPEFNDEIHQQQMEMMMMNGDKPAGAAGGRGRGRGAPGAGGRGGILGGGPPVRGAAPRGGAHGGRGAARGAPPPAARGAPSGRGMVRPPAPPVAAPPPQPRETYEDYSQPAYEDPYADPYAARDPYADTSYSAGDTQYFDYGHGSTTTGYEDTGYGESSWGGAGAQQLKAPAPRGGRGQYRAHPYGTGRGAY